MKKIILYSIISFISLSCVAQKKVKELKVVELNNDSDIYLVVDEMPMFNGNDTEQELFKYFQSSTKKELTLKPKRNKSFSVQIIIDIDGSINSYKILEGPEGELKNEVIEMLDNMPTWTAGKHKGKPVKVLRRISINFK